MTTREIKFSRNVWIDSEINAVGDGTNTKVVFQPNAFNINSGEQMKLSVSSFEIRQNWYSIAAPNNLIYWYGKTAGSPSVAVYTPITIPAGSYRDFDVTTGGTPDTSLLTGIKTGLTNSGLFTSTTVVWNRVTRTWAITVAGAVDTAGYFVSFQVKVGSPPTGVTDNGFFNDSAEIYGGYTTVDKNQILNMFVNSTNTAPSVGNVTHYSPFIGQLSSLEAVFLRVSLPTNSYQTFGFERDLPNQTGVTSSSIWARIPLTNSIYLDIDPFLSYTENGGDNFVMFLQQKQLDTMILTITDDKNRNISLYAPKGSADNGSLSFKMCMKWDILDNVAITPKIISLEGLKTPPLKILH
jgi:hypothetical protein